MRFKLGTVAYGLPALAQKNSSQAFSRLGAMGSVWAIFLLEDAYKGSPFWSAYSLM
jgi:hypothetical protein